MTLFRSRVASSEPTPSFSLSPDHPLADTAGVLVEASLCECSTAVAAVAHRTSGALSVLSAGTAWGNLPLCRQAHLAGSMEEVCAPGATAAPRRIIAVKADHFSNIALHIWRDERNAAAQLPSLFAVNQLKPVSAKRDQQ